MIEYFCRDSAPTHLGDRTESLRVSGLPMPITVSRRGEHRDVCGMRTSDDAGGFPGYPANDAGAAARASECFTFLRSVPILFEIGDDALWDIASSAEHAEFLPGERVVSEGVHE